MLDASADDWESLDQIHPYVCKIHVTVEAIDVAEVIDRLMGRA